MYIGRKLLHVPQITPAGYPENALEQVTSNEPDMLRNPLAETSIIKCLTAATVRGGAALRGALVK